jgi:hypothetical protein
MKKLDSVRKIQERINPINEIDSQTRNREKVNIRKNKKYNYYIAFIMNTECSWSQFSNPNTIGPKTQHLTT